MVTVMELNLQHFVSAHSQEEKCLYRSDNEKTNWRTMTANFTTSFQYFLSFFNVILFYFFSPASVLGFSLFFILNRVANNTEKENLPHVTSYVY